MPHPLSRHQRHGGRDLPRVCADLCVLPDRPVGHCGALSLFEAYGETAQCLDSITDERGAGAGVRRGVPAPRAAVEASPGPPVGPEAEAKTLLDAADAAYTRASDELRRLGELLQQLRKTDTR